MKFIFYQNKYVISKYSTQVGVALCDLQGVDEPPNFIFKNIFAHCDHGLAQHKTKQKYILVRPKTYLSLSLSLSLS